MLSKKLMSLLATALGPVATQAADRAVALAPVMATWTPLGNGPHGEMRGTLVGDTIVGAAPSSMQYRAPLGTEVNMNRLICSAIVTLAASAPAWSQGKLDAHDMKAFGGAYMLDCANNASAKATVSADALIVMQGDKRVAGARPESAAAFYGPNQPPEYRTVLMSEAPGGQLRLAIYQDKSGYYLVVDADAKVQAAIGKPFGQQKFRRCDGGASKPAPAAAAAPAKKYELHELGASDVLLDPKLKATYLEALGPLARERWLTRLDGPAPMNKRIKVAGADFVQLSSCKNHDCADHSAVFLYSVEQDVLYGTIYQQGRTTLIGAPPPAVASALPALWKKEWRQ